MPLYAGKEGCDSLAKPHPIYGTPGVTECTLQCDEPDCGKLVIEP